MKITFEEGFMRYEVEVRALAMLNNIQNPDITGIRKGNTIFLGEDVFKKYHKAICEDDFETLQQITAKLLWIEDAGMEQTLLGLNPELRLPDSK
jgi:hypothetical protein